MGIQGLTKLLIDNSADAIELHGMEEYNGKKIAVDATMSIYQFLIAMNITNLTDANGQVTKYVYLFFSSVRNGIVVGVLFNSNGMYQPSTRYLLSYGKDGSKWN